MKCTGRSESGKKKKKYLLRERLHMSWISSPQKKKNEDKQVKIHAGDQTSEEGAEGEEGEWASARVSGSLE